ncbi:substrate-binding periplasmic protein [Radicibacter daui]|uniref:substrate-binding periplasmic protein n=1 Tax=Radicibacter daui TaxID=3064829 RepID=UPI004046F49D
MHGYGDSLRHLLKHCLPLLALAMMAAILARPVAAQGVTSPVRLTTGTDYAPFSDPTLPNGGLATTVVIAALDSQKLDWRLVYLPWARGYLDLSRGTVDLSFPYIRTPQRQAEMLYSRPLFEVVQRLLIRRKDAGEAQSLDWLKARNLCSPIGYGLPPEITELLASGQTRESQPDDSATCLDMLALGRTDAILVNESRLEAMLKQRPAERDLFTLADFRVHYDTLHVIAGRQNPQAGALITALNRGLDAIAEDGRLAEIAARFDFPAKLIPALNQPR